MKKFFMLIILFLATSFWLADFYQDLDYIGLPVSQIENQKAISRYDIARYISLFDCEDCLSPSQKLEKNLNQNYWNSLNTQGWKYFWDISFWNAFYNKKNYFSCVAYAAWNGYINWYAPTSPVCSWKYCGSSYMTNAEFLQVLFNAVAKSIYQDYSVDWKNVQADANSSKYYDIFDKSIISRAIQSCWWNAICNLKNANQLGVYAKYCTNHLAECKMQDLGYYNRWPVAEMNILLNEKILDISSIKNFKLDSYVSWKFVVSMLKNYKLINRCELNTDYDSDWVKNLQDNCKNEYNPSQKDTDVDWVGDVCDDDIDWDWIKNPVWILNDFWYVDISKKTQASKNSSWYTFRYITSKIDWNKVDFELLTDWKIENVTWDFWDWKNWNWKNVSHSYEKSGYYNITASDWKTKVSTSIYIDTNSSKISITTNWNTINWSYFWSWKNVTWNYWDWTSGTWSSISHTYQKPGTYTVSINDWSTTKNVAVVIWGNIFINHSASWNKVNFSTNLTWTLAWDFGDWTNWTWQNPSHTYTKPGTYLVTVTDWKNTYTKVIVVWTSTNNTNNYQKNWNWYNVSVNWNTLSWSYSGSKNTTWDYWDGTSWTWNWVTHTYQKPWDYRVTIKDWNTTTKVIITIWSWSWNNTNSSSTTNNTNTSQNNNYIYLVPKISWKNVSFTISTNITNPKSITWDFWDWDTSQGWNTATHTYNHWNYYPKVTLVDQNWKTYTSSANVIIGDYNSDNCLLTKNPDQKDSNWNWIWDECEKNSWALQISVSLSGTNATFTSNNPNTNRNFWDWKNSNQQNPTHSYNPWNYYVVAKDNNSNTSSLYISIPSQNGGVAISTNGSALQNWKNINVTNQTNSKNPITYVYDSKTTTKNPNEGFLTKVETYGCQKVDSQTSTKTSSSFTICTNNSWTQYISSLVASNLTPKLGEKVDFNFSIDGSSTPVNVKQINRNIAWSSFSNTNFQASKILDKYWPNSVSAEAVLADWTKLYSSLTLDVWQSTNTKNYSLETSVSGKTASYNIVWIDKPVKNILWSYWDWITATWISPSSSHQYNTNWNFLTKAIISFGDGTQVTLTSTATIGWLDRCEDPAFVSGLKCDMNWNSVPDLCDNDIDWDWVQNPIWILSSENSSCKYDSTNVNIPILISTIESQKNQAEKWSDISDNCFLISNPAQLDANLNWIGDVCENQIWEMLKKSDSYQNTKNILDTVFPKLWETLISDFNKPCGLTSCWNFDSTLWSDWVKAILSDPSWKQQTQTDVKIVN